MALTGDDIAWADTTRLQAAMTAGEASAVQIVAALRARITAMDRAGPSLNCVAELNPDAESIAAALDAERSAGQVRGPMHGIPVLLKDNINTADELHTTAGSIAMQGWQARSDAHLVTRLRAAGAVILGKANLTEWANFMTIGMKNGYSSRGGQVLNPYGADFDAGGSSTGSAVAVAAGLVPLAVGTETSGSILSPASNNSVVGVKPTVGLISPAGIIPISATQDTAGPIARTVRDAAILLTALAEFGAKLGPRTRRAPVDYELALDRNALRGARIGVPRAVYWERGPGPPRAVAEQALEVLKAAGAELVDPADIANAAAVAALRVDVLLYEFRRELNRYLRACGPGVPIRSLTELARFYEERPSAAPFGQVLLLAANSVRGPGAAAYKHARSEDLRLAKVEGIDATLAAHNLDALVLPGAMGSAIGAKAGYPSVTVPAGYAEGGMPVGLTFLGPAWSEATLLGLAYAFEQASMARRAPVTGAG